MIFYKDFHWHFAMILGVAFWLFYGIIFNRFQLLPLQDMGRVIIFNVLIYPVLEEFVFRGWLQKKLVETSVFAANFAGISLANVITSVFFVTFHFLSQVWIQAIFIFFPSIVFGYFRDRYDRILPSILLHAFYNIGLVFLMSGN